MLIIIFSKRNNGIRSLYFKSSQNHLKIQHSLFTIWNTRPARLLSAISQCAGAQRVSFRGTITAFEYLAEVSERTANRRTGSGPPSCASALSRWESRGGDVRLTSVYCDCRAVTDCLSVLSRASRQLFIVTTSFVLLFFEGRKNVNEPRRSEPTRTNTDTPIAFDVYNCQQCRSSSPLIATRVFTVRLFRFFESRARQTLANCQRTHGSAMGRTCFLLSRLFRRI